MLLIIVERVRCILYVCSRIVSKDATSPHRKHATEQSTWKRNGRLTLWVYCQCLWTFFSLSYQPFGPSSEKQWAHANDHFVGKPSSVLGKMNYFFFLFFTDYSIRNIESIRWLTTFPSYGKNFLTDFFLWNISFTFQSIGRRVRLIAGHLRFSLCESHWAFDFEYSNGFGQSKNIIEK